MCKKKAVIKFLCLTLFIKNNIYHPKIKNTKNVSLNDFFSLLIKSHKLIQSRTKKIGYTEKQEH